MWEERDTHSFITSFSMSSCTFPCQTAKVIIAQKPPITNRVTASICMEDTGRIVVVRGGDGIVVCLSVCVRV